VRHLELRPIKTRKIYEEVIAQIKDLMLKGKIKPGDKLPIEKDLAESMQVSKASVREALRALEMMGIIEIRLGEGTYIRDIWEQPVIQSLALALTFEQQSFTEIYEIRKIIETACAELAATRHTQEDIKKMNECLVIMGQEMVNNHLGDKADTLFHYVVAEASKNGVLLRLMNTVSGSIFQTVKTARATLYRDKETAQKLLEQHGEIFEAIKIGDAPTAQSKMHYHLNFAENQFYRLLAQENDKVIN
jgi:GntR family transcriptional repressor for pyruvate dehydrogenase complex